VIKTISVSGKRMTDTSLIQCIYYKKSKALSKYSQLPVPFTNNLIYFSEKHKYMVNTNKQNTDFK